MKTSGKIKVKIARDLQKQQDYMEGRKEIFYLTAH